MAIAIFKSLIEIILTTAVIVASCGAAAPLAGAEVVEGTEATEVALETSNEIKELTDVKKELTTMEKLWGEFNNFVKIGEALQNIYNEAETN